MTIVQEQAWRARSVMIDWSLGAVRRCPETVPSDPPRQRSSWKIGRPKPGSESQDVGNSVVKPGIPVDERHQLPEFADRGERHPRQEHSPVSMGRPGGPHPEESPNDEDSEMDNLVDVRDGETSRESLLLREVGMREPAEAEENDRPGPGQEGSRRHGRRISKDSPRATRTVASRPLGVVAMIINPSPGDESLRSRPVGRLRRG
jgi:hypothetical protein